MLLDSFAVTGTMAYKERYNQDGDGRTTGDDRKAAVITSNDGSITIKHESTPERDSWGGGTKIVTETKIAPALKGHTTVHGSGDVRHHPIDEKKKR